MFYFKNFKALKRARKSTKKIESEADLIGFEYLTDAQQDLIKKCIGGDYPEIGTYDHENNKNVDSVDTSKSKKPKTKTTKPKGKQQYFFFLFKMDLIKFIWEGTVKSKEKQFKIVGPLANSHLSSGSKNIFLGRLDIPEQDKRVSKRQVELSVNSSGNLKLTVYGKNAGILTQANGGQMVLERGLSVTLGVGDKFTLLADKYPFMVEETETIPKKIKVTKPKSSEEQPIVTLSTKATKPEKETKPKKEPKSKKSGEGTVNLTSKKKSKSSDEEDQLPNEYDFNDPFIDDKGAHHHSASDDEDYVPDLDDETVREGLAYVRREEQRLKRKGGETELEPCRYGADCYQTNLKHLETYYHPPEKFRRHPVPNKPHYSRDEHIPSDEETEQKPPPSKKPKFSHAEKSTTNTSSSQEASIEELKELFPQISEDEIKRTLETQNNDLHKTMDFLLRKN